MARSKSPNLKPPDWSPERTYAALKQQSGALARFRGRNHREAESEETTWTNLTLNIITHGFGEGSNNVRQFNHARWAGIHRMGGMSEGMLQSNFEKRLKAFEATLQSCLAELELMIVDDAPHTNNFANEGARVEMVEHSKRVSNAGEAKAGRVFVVHGRDNRLRDGVFTFLRAIGLQPLEWVEAIQLTRKSSPYIGDILEAAFGHAQAVVVLLSPDDEARLRPDLVRPGDSPGETTLAGQARPNVLFEAGMAFASHSDRTVLVQFGLVRPFSDVAGRHVVLMDNSSTKRHELAIKLENAGCTIKLSGADWHTSGDLTPPAVAASSSPMPPNAASGLEERRLKIARGKVSNLSQEAKEVLRCILDNGRIHAFRLDQELNMTSARAEGAAMQCLSTGLVKQDENVMLSITPEFLPAVEIILNSQCFNLLYVPADEPIAPKGSVQHDVHLKQMRQIRRLRLVSTRATCSRVADWAAV